MKRQHYNQQKPLVKLKNLENPDYTTFQNLMVTHGMKVGQPFFAHFKTPAMKLLIFAYSRRLRELTESEYESVRDDGTKIIQVAKSYILKQRPEFSHVLNKYVLSNPVMCVADIAKSLSVSNTTVRRYIDTLRSEIVEIIADKVFNRKLVNTDDVKPFRDSRYDEFTKPFANTLNNRLWIDKLNTQCDLNWNLPDISDAQGWEMYCILAGKLFSIVSLRIACSARILFEGGTNSDVKSARIRLHIDDPYAGCKSYRHTKSAFVKYVKLHKDKVNSLV